MEIQVVHVVMTEGRKVNVDVVIAVSGSGDNSLGMTPTTTQTLLTATHLEEGTGDCVR